MHWTYHILGPDPSAGLLVVLILIIIEGILSVDNAAVLATMVMKLPPGQRGKALKYGIIGAYVFRGICLALAAWLIAIWWLEPLGGLYLLWLAWSHFSKHESVVEEAAEAVATEGNFLYRHTIGLLGPFWATVVAVEVMDLAFSIDNVVAAVAYVKNFPMPSKLVLVCTGVFLGILTMRFAAQGFVKLMQRYPFLETCAFVVIGILGIKLVLSVPRHFLAPGCEFHQYLASKSPFLSHIGDTLYQFLASHYFDLGTSVLTLLIFIVPVVFQRMKSRNVIRT
jgi:YkoY family integral membrane protein